MRFLRKLIDERLVMGIILINSLALFLGGYEEQSAEESLWFIVDYICVLYFLFETAVKILVEGRRPGRLDASYEAFLDEHPESIVDRLSGNGTDLRANVLCDVVRRAVRTTRHRPQHGQTLGRDLDTVFAKKFSRIPGHDWIVCLIIDCVNNPFEPIPSAPTSEP